MTNPLRLGMIGLDTSHVTGFAALLHDSSHPYHVPGARIVAAYPGGSPDMEISCTRVAGFTQELREKHGVHIASNIKELRDQCDALLITSVDGRIHLEQFLHVARWKLPVFIDKPLTASASEARDLAEMARQYEVPVMSASALRFDATFRSALDRPEDGAITGGDFFGPMALIPQMPGLFWYGVHQVEMLYATLGLGCVRVQAVRQGDQDLVMGFWHDGRIGTLRGNRSGNMTFGGTIHREKKSSAFDVSTGVKPFYASLLEEVIPFLRAGNSPVPLSESVEIIHFIEAANTSIDQVLIVELKSQPSHKTME